MTFTVCKLTVHMTNFWHTLCRKWDFVFLFPLLYHIKFCPLVKISVKIYQILLLCSEWAVNQHRDSLASYVGHHNLMEFFAIAENESKARVKFNFLQKMLQPCGLPPVKAEEDWSVVLHVLFPFFCFFLTPIINNCSQHFHVSLH